MTQAPVMGGFVILPRGAILLAYAVVLVTAVAAFWLLAGFPMITYHLVMSAVLLPLVAWRQEAVTRALGRLPGPPMLRFILLAYCAVMLEETLVGTLAALLAEGDPTVWADRVRQFITFNLMVFTGPIVALAAHARLCAPHRWEVLVLAGGWGLFAESVLQRLIAAPLLAGLLVWPTLVIYALIFLPATLSVAPARGHRTPPLLLRAVLVWAAAFAMSLPIVLLVEHLRAAMPDLFPPCLYMICAPE
ncbi:MAG: hypothetical protein RLZZ563_383 [Pseudomonadota bacterium]